MKSLITFSVKHPVSVLSILIAVVLIGVLCCFFVPVDFLPTVTPRVLLVAAEYEGISSEEIRSLITMPLEDAFASLKGLKSMSSVSRDGISLLTLELHWGTDTDIALTECREIIDVCYETLPAGCKKPVAAKNDAAQVDTVTIAVIPLDGDLKYGRYIADNDIKPRFQRIPGVGSVSITGGEKEQIQVRLYRDELEGRNLTIQLIADTISRANFEYPAGTIREGENELSVKTSGLFASLEEIGDMPLSFNDGAFLRLKDISDIVRTTQRKESFFLYNGLECIKIGILKKTDSSPINIALSVKDEIKILNQLYGSWCRFEITNDLSLQIIKSLFSLLLSASIGIFVAGVVLYIFLRSLKISLIIASVIPISTAVSVFILTVAGKTLNIMSLSGIAIGIGMVVDASTVVVENIQKKILNNSGEMSPVLVIEGSIEVGLSNTGSAISTIIVFIPVFFVPGLLGQLFSDMAIAVISSIATSCILSFTYIPALYVITTPFFHKKQKMNNLFDSLRVKYILLLDYFLTHPFYSFIPVFLSVFIGIFSIMFIEYRLLPNISTQSLNTEIIFPVGTSLQSMQYSAALINNQLLNEPYITSVQISGGLEHDDYAILSLPDEQPEKLRIILLLSIPAEKAMLKIEKLFNGSNISVSYHKQKDILAQLLEINDNVSVLYGDTPDSVRKQALEISEPSNIIPNITRKESIFTPDRLASARFSISAQYMASVARNTLEGVYTASYYETGREIPVLIKFRDEDIRSIQDLENILVPIEDAYIPLRILGTITEQINEKVLYRYNRKDAKQILNAIPITKSNNLYNSLISPGKDELKEMTNNGIFLLFITILLLYLVMGAQFESFILPLLLLIALPPAFSGAFLLLLITSNSLNINSIIALIILFGISINNSILLYESCNSYTVLNKKLIITACANKLRAILITNLTTIVALLPFAIDPIHINAQSSLSIAVIGGLLFSFILVLLIVPVCFLYFLPKKE
jgi:multidrug efflux pump subunit AcrB